MAHPDDPEFFCGGLIARWCATGTEVTYLILTNGDKGSDDPNISPKELSIQRRAEQQAAADFLGVKQVLYLDEPDGELRPHAELRKRVVAEMRRYQPVAVVTFDPTRYFFGDFYINHPDHRVAGEVVVEAIFPAVGNRMYCPELLAEGLLPHTVKELYLWGSEQPNQWIDITDLLQTKMEAIQCHASQVYGLKKLAEELQNYQKTVDESGQEVFREAYRVMRCW